jgi:hypothetical protein
MPYAGEPDCSTVWTDAIFDFEMPTLDAYFDSVAKERENATFTDWGFARKEGLR